MGKFIGAPPVEEVAAAQALLPEKGVLAKAPALWEYLTEAFWADGKKRLLSKLTIFVDEGQLKVSLADHALERSLYRSGETLEGCVASLEKTLAEGVGDWRKWPKKGKK